MRKLQDILLTFRVIISVNFYFIFVSLLHFLSFKVYHDFDWSCFYSDQESWEWLGHLKLQYSNHRPLLLVGLQSAYWASSLHMGVARGLQTVEKFCKTYKQTKKLHSCCFTTLLYILKALRSLHELLTFHQPSISKFCWAWNPFLSHT